MYLTYVHKNHHQSHIFVLIRIYNKFRFFPNQHAKSPPTTKIIYAWIACSTVEVACLIILKRLDEIFIVCFRKRKINICNVSKRIVQKIRPMKLKQFRPRLKTSVEHIVSVFSVFTCFRVPPDSVNPFSEMIQHFIHTEFPHSAIASSSSSSSSFSSSCFFSLSPLSSLLPHLQIHSWIPHHPSPTFKDSCGGRGGLQMVVFYGFTLFTNWFLAMWNKNRCLPPVEPPSARQKRVEKTVERGTSSRKTNDSRRIVRRIYASHTCPRHS